YLNQHLMFSYFYCYTTSQASGNSLIKYLTNDIYKQGFSLLMAFLRYPLSKSLFLWKVSRIDSVNTNSPDDPDPTNIRRVPQGSLPITDVSKYPDRKSTRLNSTHV